MHAMALAPYASDAARTRGRLVKEPESSTRTVYQRDRDRIVHAAAFRRLEYKTQVFVNHEGDYYRTRLTHSLEVAQIARSIARALDLNEDLAEALALAHDLGHPPFGHAGEDALKDAMRDWGGFDHNAQTLRILTHLEQRYAEFDGLNLSWETLEGVVKHNGPILGANKSKTIPETIAEYNGRHDLLLATWPSAEAQVAALADDIAYNNHDIDDGLRAGLFDIADLETLPLVGPTFLEVKERYPGLERARLINESIRRLIDHMVNDLLAETRRRLDVAKPKSPDDVRAAGGALVAFSEEMRGHDRALRTFLMQRMYRHYRVNRMTSKARRVVAELFHLFVAEPECLPTEWQTLAARKNTAVTARVATDYIAGMTDRYALDEHRRLFDLQARN